MTWFQSSSRRSKEQTLFFNKASLYRALWIAARIHCSVVTSIFPILAMAANQSTINPICTLPVLDDVISETLGHLPNSLTDYDTMERRAQLSVLVPEVQLQYGGNEANFNRGESMRDSGLRWENDVRVSLRWDLSELLFHNQESDIIALYQRRKENEIIVRSQIAVDYVDLKYALDQLQRKNVDGGIELTAQQKAAKIDALTFNRFGLMELVDNCLARPPNG